ncbi:MAG: biotin/lipoyl-binding protein [Clostridiales Family XIII bacterium]|jgi:multidrug efflux pump subunit AcrA (membrane-fusion protein)|nr:biotin/lipoyl-binding protein [Clostridiales Family XIII bacterium]
MEVRRKRKKWPIVLAIIVAVVVLAGLGLNYLGSRISGVLANSMFETAVVERGDIVSSVTATSNLAEGARDVRIPYDVKVTEVFVKPGDIVAEGDKIASIDKTSLDEQLKKTRTSLDAINKQIETAGESGGLTALRQNLEARLAALEEISGREKKEIYANANGTVSSVNISAGAALSRAPTAAASGSVSAAGVSIDPGAYAGLGSAAAAGLDSAAIAQQVDWSEVFANMPADQIPWEQIFAQMPVDQIPWDQLFSQIPADQIPWEQLFTQIPADQIPWDEIFANIPWDQIPKDLFPGGGDDGTGTGEGDGDGTGGADEQSYVSPGKQENRPLASFAFEKRENRPRASFAADYGSLDAYLNSDSGTTAQAVEEGPSGVAISIIPADAYSITVQVDELDILAVEEGQTALITLDAIPDVEFEGLVSKVSKQTQASAGIAKYPVVLALPKTEQMRIGMNASVIITTNKKSGVLHLPAMAIQEEDGVSFVWTGRDVKTGEFTGRTDVTTGLSDGSIVEITDGPAEGAEVYYAVTISSDMSNLYMGF